MSKTKNLRCVPEGPHFAILTERAIHDRCGSLEPLDGNLPPEEFLVYEAYADEKKWVKRITELVKAGEQFKAIKVEVATVDVSVDVSVDEPGWGERS